MQDVSKVIDYKKVFISFSFIDKKISTRLYNELTNQGVRCFFWERDAPPGEGLKEIMEKNVMEHDRILFVASANSIKSEACQFELSEGRKKQAKTWEDTLFPIHIDDFLFEVKKNQIRPVTATEEYWKNIEELCRINSADFKRFNRDKIDTKKFKEAVSIIVRQLKLKPNN